MVDFFPKWLYTHASDTLVIVLDAAYAKLFARALGVYTWIEKFFSTGGWTVKQSHTDPALWILTSPDNHLVLLVCYSDDIDAVGELTSDIQLLQNIVMACLPMGE